MTSELLLGSPLSQFSQFLGLFRQLQNYLLTGFPIQLFALIFRESAASYHRAGRPEAMHLQF